MTESNCSGCQENHNCGQMYEQLGKSDAERVIRKVVLAFLLPIAVFIAAIVVFDKFFASRISGKNLGVLLSSLFATAISFVCVLVIRVFNKKFDKNKKFCKKEYENRD